MTGSDDLTAWAAGLYDGDGSASMYVPKLRKTARRQIQVSQGGSPGVLPEVLVRFGQIVGEGNVTGPYRGYLFYWKATSKDAIDRVAMKLWPYLSEMKRSQFEQMTLAAGRRMPMTPPTERGPTTEVAWAAGLFDSEGSISVSGGSRSPQMHVELAQASSGGIPDTLIRFHEITGRGAIHGPYEPRSPWSRLPQYRWSVTGRHATMAVLSVLWPWLSSVKRSRAESLATLPYPGPAELPLTRT